MRAAERGQRVRDGQRAVVRDPVAHLQVGRGVAQVDDLFRALRNLPGRERDRHRHRARHRPPGHRAVPALPAEAGPAGGKLAHGEVAEAGGQRGEHEHHRPCREAAREQQRKRRQQPGRGQQRGHDGDGAEQPPGPPPGALAGTLLGALAGTLLGALAGTLLGALAGTLLGALPGALLGALPGALAGHGKLHRGIICLSELGDPIGTRSKTHGPTLGPARAGPGTLSPGLSHSMNVAL